MATELATLVSEALKRHFDCQIQQLRALCNAWKADRETAVKVLNGRHEAFLDNVTCENENNQKFQSDIDDEDIMLVRESAATITR